MRPPCTEHRHTTEAGQFLSGLRGYESRTLWPPVIEHVYVDFCEEAVFVERLVKQPFFECLTIGKVGDDQTPDNRRAVGAEQGTSEGNLVGNRAHVCAVRFPIGRTVVGWAGFVQAMNSKNHIVPMG
jgi:hypothetical protein